jgi:hypothetical protein
MHCTPAAGITGHRQRVSCDTSGTSVMILLYSKRQTLTTRKKLAQDADLQILQLRFMVL